MMRKLDCNSSFFSIVGPMEVAGPCIGPLLKVWRCQIQSGIWWKDRRWFKFVDLSTSVGSMWIDGNSQHWQFVVVGGYRTHSIICVPVRQPPNKTKACAVIQMCGNSTIWPNLFFEKQCISQNITCRGQRCPISGSTSKNLMTRLEDLMMRMSRQRVLNILQNNFHSHRIHV